ncbi:LysM peptidoglycan-binding domain-containing protein [Nocardioides sp. 1609]|uniref:LysM peptidoglycan-binding domain-containing protein n=1 Tax=Nocardioides sp. 1609 TaxID=2508327 RepID=UPI00106F951D|nr:LysM peptidoglycan-binding domain-containing protein [Nocardioides sp. 1609]
MSTTTIAPTAPAAARLPDYRLTRRGRLAVLVLALLVLAAVGVAFAGNSMATAEREATETIVVAPGETLWSIASDVSDGDDVRDTMDHLVQLNDLADVSLDAGQRLEVPVD